MKIKEIKINNYGILKNKKINFENKLNIIYGKNESGKSTLLNYIKNIFYGISKNKNGKNISEYEKYLPWNEEEFSGKIKYELDNGENFEVFRDFKKKNPKIFNSNLEDVSGQFNIDKKDGSKFFYDQTKVDEDMFSSTVLSMQQEVKLSKSDQNVLVQKVANLAASGEDTISYKRALDRLNRSQLEEVGTERSQEKPINKIRKRLEDTLIDIETIENKKDSLENLQGQIEEIKQEIEKKELKNYAILELHKIKSVNEIEKEKIKVKEEINNEKKEKINKLNLEKNELDRKKEINDLNNKKNIKIKQKNNKKINLIFIIFLIIIILFNLINFIFIKNKILNYLLLILIPILLIIFFITKKINNKKYNLNNKNNINNLDEEIENKIINLNTQINILNEEILKQNKIISEENNKLNLNYNLLLENLIKKYNNNEIINLINNLKENSLENINYYIHKNQEEINNKKIEKNKIDIDIENINNNLENLINLEEEKIKLQKELKQLENKNNSFNIAKEVLQIAYEKMKNNVTPKFTKNLSQTINKISNGKYNKVTINDEEGLMVELENGEYITADRLSIGTIDQLYLSLRLSMAEEISEEKMPVILDEAFAYFDDYRLENALKFLVEELEENQIILFTCTKREEEILNRLNIKYNLIEL
ncbi:MAG: AAA family ATPase [Clostridia bacterium]